MKKNGLRFLSLVLCLGMFLSVAISAQATVKASDYFARTQVWATKQGGGEFIVEYDILATDFMDEIGASVIMIMEEQSNGTFKNVYTFDGEDMGLIDTDRDDAYGLVTYEGTPGVRYYALCGLYAKNSAGNETLYFATNTITA